MNCAVVSCASARIANEIALATVPAARTARKPMRLPSRPAERAADEHRERRGRHQQPGLQDGHAEPVARRLRRLRELRDHEERAEHRHADEEARDVRRQHGALGEHPHVHERLAAAQLERDEDAQDGDASEQRDHRLPRAPAPRVRLRDAEQQRRQPEREQRGAGPVDPRALPRRRRPGRRDGRANAAGSASSPIQKSQEMSVLSTMAPDSGRPMPPPMPNIAEIIPMATERRSAGSSSLMIPKASGNTPPATPWITRPAMTISIEPASADTIEPKEKMSSTPVSTRALPNRSPSLPASGVQTEAESRKPVSTQDVVEDSVPNSRVSAGIAGATSVCARAYASADSRSAPMTGAAGLPWTVLMLTPRRRPRSCARGVRPCRRPRRARPGARRSRRAGRRAARA